MSIPSKVCFYFGVAKVRKIGSNKNEGVRMEHIDYTNRDIYTIDMFAKHMKEECDHIRKLTGEGNLTWVECGQPKDELWANDSILYIKGAGGEKGETLVLDGITTGAQLKAIQTHGLLNLNGQFPGISIDTLKNWRDIPCHNGTFPHKKIDHRTAASSYLSKYGVDEWRKECENSVFMPKYISVTELVTKMHNRMKEAFVGTTHEYNCFFTMMR